MYTEEELISRILLGNLDAFTQLVGQYKKLVIGIVSRIVIQESDAQDICQEVFLKVYQNLSTFKYKSKLGTWIASIAYSTAINHLKKTAGKSFSNLDIEKLENQQQDTSTPESIFLKKNTSVYLQQQINKLPVQYRTVLTLYHLEELTYDEIQKITGMPEGTVKNYLFRARKLLKDKLEKYLK